MLVVVQHCYAFYRRAIFDRLLAGEVGMKGRLVFGRNPPSDNVKAYRDIESIPTCAAVERSQYVLARNWWIKWPLVWQRGVLREVFRKDVKCVIVELSPNILSTWIALVLLRLFTKKRLLGWTHGLTSRPRGIRGMLKMWLLRLPHGLLLYGNRARKILVEEHGFEKENLYVVFNSLDYAHQVQVRESQSEGGILSKRRELFPDSPSDPILMYIGRLNRSKKLDMLLQAASSTLREGRSVNVLLIGEGDAVDELSLQAQALSLGDRFVQHEACYDESELARLISCSDVCVAPSHLGLTGMHSLVYGTPVITHGDLDRQTPECEAVVPGRTGDYFQFDDVKSLEQKIANWFASQVDRKSVATVCEEVISSFYSPDAQMRILGDAVRGNPAVTRLVLDNRYALLGS